MAKQNMATSKLEPCSDAKHDRAEGKHQNERSQNIEGTLAAPFRVVDALGAIVPLLVDQDESRP
jgi:hypothetical protein